MSDCCDDVEHWLGEAAIFETSGGFSLLDWVALSLCVPLDAVAVPFLKSGDSVRNCRSDIMTDSCLLVVFFKELVLP